ncbi:GntR family transcriptional regulator [Niallia taxi]|nr:GntR family transcriptional regulator [Niallia taxi]MDE5053377.1 GntR family transcriptional regulator [Niallia taxi]
MLKYQKIALEMARHITENLQQKDKLPVIETLISHYNVSKSTIIKALKVLEDKGIIYMVRGSGIFVRGEGRKGYYNLLGVNELQEDANDNRYDLLNIMEIELICALPEVTTALGLEKNAKVYSVKYVYYLDKQVTCLEQVFLNQKIISNLDEEIALKPILKYIKDVLGIKMRFPDIYVNVDKLNAEEASCFGLNAGDPMLCKEIIYHLANGQPFCYSRAVFHYKQAKFFLKVNSPN